MGGGTPTDLGSCGGLRWLALGVAELRRRPKSLMRLSAACWEAKGDGIGLSEIVRAPMGSHGRERRHDSCEEEDLGLPCRGCGRSVGGDGARTGTRCAWSMVGAHGRRWWVAKAVCSGVVLSGGMWLWRKRFVGIRIR